jgi:hypothetical protein
VNCRDTAGADPFDRRAPELEDGFRGRAAGTDESSNVPLEQIGQSAVKRLWRQKSEFKADV